MTKMNTTRKNGPHPLKMQDIRKDHLTAQKAPSGEDVLTGSAEILRVIDFLESFNNEVDTALDTTAPNPYLNIALSLIRNHLEGKTVTALSLIHI